MSKNLVAQTILAQLGNGMFRLMTGAKNFMSDGNSLIFSLPQRKINKVRITLNGQDLYDIEYSKFSPSKRTVTPVLRHYNIGADQLRAMFKQATGLDTSL